VTAVHHPLSSIRGLLRGAAEWVTTPLWRLTAHVYGPRPWRPERNPLEFVFFAVIAGANLPIALGIQPLPNSLERTPDLFGQSAAACFVFGAAMCVLGLAWPNKNNRLVIEQVGLVFAGFGLLCYGFAIANTSTWTQARIAASLSWGVSAGTGARYAQIAWFFRQQHGQILDARTHAREGQQRGSL
jgi:hypothetical protein